MPWEAIRGPMGWLHGTVERGNGFSAPFSAGRRLGHWQVPAHSFAVQ